MKGSKPNKIFLILSVFFLMTSPNLFAQKQKLTYKQIFKFAGPQLTQALPNIEKWIDENHYLEIKSFGDKKTKSLVKIDAESGEEELYLDYESWNKLLPDGLNINSSENKTEDLNTYLFLHKNDLYYLSIEDNLLKKIADDGIERSNPTLAENGKLIAYTIKRDLYIYDVEKEKEIRITNDASDAVYNGYASWVYYEEILGRKSQYSAFWISPNGKHVAFLRFDDTPVPIYQLYNPDGTHGEWEKERYPKAGDPLPKVKFGIADVETGQTIWADFDEKDDQMIAWPSWSADGKNLLIQWMNRKMDNIKIFSIDLVTGKKKEIYDEKQNSWVEFFEDIYVFKNGSGYLVRSDKDGFRHLYYFDWNGKLLSKITTGNWSVNEIVLVDEKNATVYFHCDKDESTEQQLYKIKLDGSELTQLTSETGTHNCTVSPTGKYILDKFSNITTPTTLALLDKSGKKIKELGNSRTKLLDDYNLGKVEILRIPTEAGYNLPLKWFFPADFDQSKKYPVLFSVYGGPYAASVSNSWSRMLSPYYYAQQGIIYVIVDNRGSGHFGKKGAAELHRNLGRYEIDDIIEAARWVRSKPFIDTSRVAITGGSYGGYAALMGITRGSDVFNYAVAEYSVTDWNLYDNVYTERYMDRPDENPDGYEFGSVMNHADKYKGMVLITHGTMDDNVHPQNSLQIISKFEDLDKDFEMMFYPKARHGVGFPKFFHANRLKMKFIYKYLLQRELNVETD